MKRFTLFLLGLFLCLGNTKAQSSVDTNIAVNDNKQDKTFVVIISNENYKHEEAVPFAKNDGEVFKIYCQKTLGIPEDHIRFAPNATLGEMNFAIYWLGNMLKAYDGEAKAIFYYSGHGMPDENGKEAYLLPVDGFSQSTEGALSTKNLYSKLGDMTSRNIVVFLDACFSGTKRDGKMLASSRGVAIKVKSSPVADNTVVFSAATGDETAYPFKSQKHGLFTYYVLDKMQKSGGYTTLGELSDYVTQNVKRKAVLENNGKSQTPTVIAASNNKGWRNWRFADKAAKQFENRNVSSETLESTITKTVDKVSVQAKDLIGTWKSSNDNNGQKIDIFFTFNESTFSMKNVISGNDSKLGIITISLLIPGDYSLKGDKLTIKSKANKVELKVDNIEFVGEAAERIRQKPELKEQVMKMLEKEIKKTKRKFTSGFPENGDVPIISFTDDQLVLSLGRGEAMTFTRVN